MQTIMTVLHLPPRENLRRRVSGVAVEDVASTVCVAEGIDTVSQGYLSKQVAWRGKARYTEERFIDVCAFEESGSAILGDGGSFAANNLDN